jgi:Domain of unknown function (DUF4369)
MRKLLACLISIPLISCSQPKDVKIHVRINGIPDNTKFYLFRAFNLDSAISKNGQFDLKYHKFSSSPEATVITTGYKEPGIMCWIENEDMTIECNYSDLNDTKSAGSVTQKEFEKLLVLIKPNQLRLKELRREVRSERDSTQKELIQHILDSLQLIYKKKIEDFVIANPNSSVSTFILMLSANETFTKDEVLALFSKLDKAQQESETGKSLIQTLEMLEQIRSQNKNLKPGN